MNLAFGSTSFHHTPEIEEVGCTEGFQVHTDINFEAGIFQRVQHIVLYKGYCIVLRPSR